MSNCTVYIFYLSTACSLGLIKDFNSCLSQFVIFSFRTVLQIVHSLVIHYVIYTFDSDLNVCKYCKRTIIIKYEIRVSGYVIVDIQEHCMI